MSTSTPDADDLHHHARRMGGRDPHEAHRSATPLELLFDLTFVISFGFAASRFAHALAEGHYAVALLGFAFASFAICWAWINFSWFSSAYDTDDWLFRLLTMAQMAGVLVLAIGLPRMFASLEDNDGRVDNTVMVLGYVIMRIALVLQWLRAAKQDPARRRVCLTYAVAIVLAQIGWTATLFVDLPAAAMFVFICTLVLTELAGPVLAERKDGGTPWHAHHIVERHGLFAIIALGEGVVGTVATLSAVVDTQGWTLDTALVCAAGVGLTFGMWWIYYILPSAHVLREHRERSFVWGYSQMAIVTAIVATGAGLHVAAYYLEHKAHISAFAVLLTTAIPVSVFIGSIYALYYYLVRRFDPFHLWLLLLTAAVVAAAVVAALAGVRMSVCLCILTLAPVVTVVGYEVRGHRHEAESLARGEAGHPAL
ncbi:low temperature requirement protein A [Lysobacter sp. M2-1]|uniref:low temperature requirement protein A n=1 Tax=Lysobacter sp. M2-1 TaxID=2916839 RepID=UPI001F593DE9|nr:low temperature requirement protein A [Lysobacter sp. M2-1]